MKLFLIRHSVAEKGNGVKDFDRNLTEIGIKRCEKLATFIEKNSSNLTFISSSALRAKQTTQNIYENLTNKPQVIFDEKLYYCPVSYFYELLRSSLITTDLAIVAHNPSIHQFCLDLIEGEPLVKFFSPASAAIFQVEHFQNLKPHSAKLLVFKDGDNF